MATQTAPLGLRLFLEGVEVPVIGAQVSIQQGQPAAAAIQIIPTDSALLLLPRTLVHLFYLDNEFIDPATENRADRVNRNRDDSNRFHVADEQYKLLFSGEIIGYSYTKTPSSRSLVLQCLDLSSYWDTCYQWFADYSVGGSGLTDRSHNFVAAGQYLFNNVASGTRWVIGNILSTKPENPDYHNTEGLLAGYIHLLESIGGIRPRRSNVNDYKAYRGVNDFFTIAELRYNLSGMIGAVESDTTSARMFAHKAFMNWLMQGMASAGSLVSYRDVLALVGQYIFHDVYPNPAPLYVRGGTHITQRVPKNLVESSIGDSTYASLREAKTNIDSAATNVDAAIASIPHSVEDFESVALLSSAIDFLEIASTNVSNSGASDASRINSLILLTASAVQGAQATLLSARRVRTALHLAGGEAESISSALATASANLERILSSSNVHRIREEAVTVASGDHLYNQLILPETFFVVPPRCNVLFPDMYFSFSYSRNFLREVSRLSCQGGLGFIAGGNGFDTILGSYYVAPNVKDVRGKIARSTIFSYGSTILPHEVHSGIIPKYEWVTDGHRWGVEAAKARGKNTREKKISYIQRLANFQFFTHRWAARTMNVQGRFNPHLVAGFPGVVIDRASPSIGMILSMSTRADVGQALLPTAYVGKIAAIQHTVGQDGGVSSVAYSQSRTHRGIDDEFLGVLEREEKAETFTPIDIKPSELVTLVQSGGFVEDRIETLLQLYIRGQLTAGLEFLDGKITFVDASNLAADFTFADLEGLGVSLADFDTYQLRHGQSGGTTISLPTIITVTLRQRPLPGKFIRKEGAPPFEDLVRPAYYSPDVWTNDNITEKVYLPLLGSFAITDDSHIGDPEQFASLVKTAIDNAGDVTSAVDVTTEGDNVVLNVDGRPAATIGLNLETGTTTETAIDGLTLLYGILKKRNLDVQSFIDDYVKRPIANLVEILGDSDLQFDANGDVKPRSDGTIPVEGFHSRAFGPYNADVKHRVDTGEDSTPPEAGADAFFGLIPPDKVAEFDRAPTIIRKNESRGSRPIPRHLDPRGRAQARVRIYADELAVTRGILAT